MLSEINQSQKGKYRTLPLCEVPRLVKLMAQSAEWWLPGPEGGEGGKGEWGVVI